MTLVSYTEEKPHYYKRLIWMAINKTIFRLAIGRAFKWFRHGLLRMFGAEIDKDAYVYHSVDIFMPWNLVCGRACIGPDTNIYNKAKITIGNDTVISQGSFLCTAGHDITSKMLPLKTAPIIIENNVWIAADCFVGPGVTFHNGAVLGARGCIFKDAESMGVYGGNPAKFIKKRILQN